MRFNIIIVVWGPTYIASLCEITLPSLVPSQDIFSISEDRWTFLISTRREEEQTIRECLGRLFPSVDVVFDYLEPQTFENHYLAMANAHHRSAKLSIAHAARGIIVPPDAVFSADALQSIVSVAKAGKRALMVCGPRLREATAFAAIKDLIANTPQIPPRALVTLALEHLHPEMRRYFWASENFSTLPSICCWDAPKGWLARNFHLHPLMVDFSTDAAITMLENDTIDGEFVGAMIGVWDDIHIVQDSDQLVVFTLTPDQVFYSSESTQPASLASLRKTAYHVGFVNPLHRWFFTKAVKIHSDDLDGTWRALEEETGRMTFEILSLKPQTDNLPSPASVEETPDLDAAAGKKTRIEGSPHEPDDAVPNLVPSTRGEETCNPAEEHRSNRWRIENVRRLVRFVETWRHILFDRR